ncbi:MAG: hypothetical protein IJ368_09905 [Oscillospiraceae bacterium]|nr:hypothetical protein [Oscillospiraceae bacterium]MBQ8435490.1 hypothetical protein [Oscillospiraceae bacterium]
MDNFKDSYVILFRNVTKCIEHLEKIKLSIPSEEICKDIEYEITFLKHSQNMAEDAFINKNDFEQHNGE